MGEVDIILKKYLEGNAVFVALENTTKWYTKGKFSPKNYDKKKSFELNAPNWPSLKDRSDHVYWVDHRRSTGDSCHILLAGFVTNTCWCLIKTTSAVISFLKVKIKNSISNHVIVCARTFKNARVRVTAVSYSDRVITMSRCHSEHNRTT